MKRTVIIFISLVILMMVAPLQAKAEVPDSLMAVRDKLNELLKGIEKCEQSIVTSDDLDFYNSRLEQLRDGRNRLLSAYPLSDNDELWALVTRFDNCDKRISDRVVDWEKKKRLIVLADRMTVYSRTFDSLYKAGEEYASKKAADSVRSIKLKADDQWTKVYDLKSTDEEAFENDSLKALYKHVETVRGKIQELSEKERMKARDILLIVGVFIAAVAMTITVVRSFSITKKSKETPSIEI